MASQPRVPMTVEMRQAELRHAGRATLAAVAVAIGAGVVFTLFPALDIAASAAFYVQGEGFALANSAFWQTVRTITLRGYTFWYVAIVVAAILAVRWQQEVLGLDWRRWLYLGITSLLGPALLTNALLKAYWGRFRPREITELGGTEQFTAPFDLSGSCLGNCSFVSGEVSSMVMVFAGLAFAAIGWRHVIWPLLFAFGALAALLRVGQGGHFLSDSLLAGAFMVLVAAGTYWAMFLSPYALADDAGRAAMHRRWLAWHDRFFAALCGAGLRLLDRLAPRR